MKRGAETYVECLKHRPGEGVGVVLTRKVESIHLLVVSPLVERDRGLIVLQPLQDRAVDDDLVILELPADHAERVVHLMMIKLDLRQAG